MTRIAQHLVISILIGVALISAPSYAGIGPVIGINPCPTDYTNSHFEQIHGWNVCVDSQLLNANGGGASNDFAGGCPLVMAGPTLQAWNPEAGVCLSVKQQPVTTDNDVFTLVRDFDKNIIKIDVHSDVVAAGCVGNSNAYLLSPNNVYCLKNEGAIDGLSFEDIESMAENYYELLYGCNIHDSEVLQSITSEYQRYIDAAYYKFLDSQIRWQLSSTNKQNAQHPSSHHGYGDSKFTTEFCGIPNVSRIIGLSSQ